ncbi:hypothetical protein A4E84_00730 [Streptomyces qaidamensis]|uniref:Uncharacterized protein n=1 Tax=Streptomyces qaidamensis TaxID=1783515 RepID=A0A143BSG0_9ACTN|nr:hypothetical protein [Streptomyces qaidamensis]AMW08188.1 hypothetical protein A4E84_00730 [Streptomyces qaidamensis]
MPVRTIMGSAGELGKQHRWSKVRGKAPQKRPVLLLRRPRRPESGGVPVPFDHPSRPMRWIFSQQLVISA